VRLLLVAYPGAGKGTQAAKLSAHYGIEHLSSGALLRHEVTQRTKIGRIAADYLERGDLVPDELVFEILTTPLLEAARNGGYVLDGYPRTLRQAEEAYAMAQRLEGIELQAVVYLRVGHDETQPLLGFYAGRGILLDINGEQSVPDVFADITKAIDGLRVLQVQGGDPPPAG
jgi:adenylate kinase